MTFLKKNKQNNQTEEKFVIIVYLKTLKKLLKNHCDEQIRNTL